MTALNVAHNGWLNGHQGYWHLDNPSSSTCHFWRSLGVEIQPCFIMVA